jgi:hypothetical protein
MEWHAGGHDLAKGLEATDIGGRGALVGRAIADQLAGFVPEPYGGLAALDGLFDLLDGDFGQLAVVRCRRQSWRSMRERG